MSHTTTTKYDVFLSFRGEDTRHNFTSHLFAELCRKKIKTFIDDELERGDEISSSLIKAIEESSIYVVILSKHYASSSWCLDELIKILKCKRSYGREVIPVFYEVDPSDVRHQKNSYLEDFVKHQERYSDKVDKWKAALTEVANISGWPSKETRQSTLVEQIAEDISKKLNHCVSSDDEGIIGIEKHIEKIQPLLLLESAAVRIIGIWGMGGIGKSTIANAIYRKLIADFSSGSIVPNVQQEIERAGLDDVRRKCFSDNPRLKRTKVLLVLDDVKDAKQLKDLIGTHRDFGQGSRVIVTSRDKQVLKNANADEIYQVKEMNSQHSLRLFYSCAFKKNHPIEPYVSLSKKVLDYAKGVPLALIVLGSLLYGRTKEVWESQLQKLQKLPDDEIFSVLKLSYDGLGSEQKEIFLDIACFYKGRYENFAVQTLDCCGFSTLIGMEVLKDRCLISITEKGRVWMHDLIQEMGHEIVRLECVKECGKRSRLWKPDDIYDVLSKNKGTDAIQCIFLDMLYVKKDILEIHDETFKKMHNLRVMHFHQSWRPYESIVIFHSLGKSFPDELKHLHWDGFPQRSLPLEFCPENLVSLSMPHSHLVQLWDEDKALPNLKRLNLRYSKKLIRVPDLSLSPYIEEIILSGCVSLEKFEFSKFLNNLNWLCLDGCTALRSLMIRSNILWRPSGLVALRGCRSLETLSISSTADVMQPSSLSFCFDEPIVVFEVETRIQPYAMGGCLFTEDGDDGYHKSIITELCWLDVSYCRSLTCLPADLLNFKFLRRLSFSCCLKLKELPEIKETMENLTVLNLDGTAITDLLPSSLHHLVGLQELSLQCCKKLKTIPSSIGNLSKLVKLDLTDCESLETFPELEVTMENLKVLILERTAITELPPSSLHHLVGLQELSLQCCTKLKTVPSSIGNLSKLLKLNLAYCESLETFPELEVPMENLKVLILDETTIKELLPSSLHCLVGIQELSLRCCTKLKTIPSSIGNLSKLLKLNLSNCESLETFPSSIFKLKLTKLHLRGCSMLNTFPEIPSNIDRLSSLTELSLEGSIIVNLPESIANLSSLTSLDISDCRRLEYVPKLPPNLNNLLAFDCLAIKKMVLNSRSKLQSDSKNTFEFHLTNCQEPEASFSSNIAVEAWVKITDNAYWSVFFCFPGSAVPPWFHYSCRGHSVTMKKHSPSLCSKNRLIGFAMCVVLGLEDVDATSVRFKSLRYKLSFESSGQTHAFHDSWPISVVDGICESRFIMKDHTYLWKYQFESADIGNELFHAHNFTFEILDEDLHPLSSVKECGMYPLYIKENDDNGIEEPSGSIAAQ